MGLDLTIRSTWKPQNTKQTVAKLFAFPRKVSKFAPPCISLNSTILLMFVLREGRLYLQVVVIEPDNLVDTSNDVEIPLSNAEDIIDISCDASGYASVLG